MVILVPYNPYIQKSELDQWVRKNRQSLKFLYSFVTLFFAVVELLLFLVVNPKIGLLYTEAELTLPNYTYLAMLFAFFTIGINLVLIWTKNPINDAEVANQRSSSDELVNTEKLKNRRLILTIFGLLLLGLVISFISIILPIYQISDSIK